MATNALKTRTLGRTRREVTTLGLGGQGALMLTPDGVDPVAIIETAFSAGITYFDTSNAYGPSQAHYGAAFRKLGLVPDSPGYDSRKRSAIYLASKTHIRTSRQPAGQHWRSDYSDGFSDGSNVATAADDVRRSLTQIFGDGRGGYPPESYLDCIQLHNITDHEDVDMIFKGFDDPYDGDPWLGALVSLLDLRDGTNDSGQNPKRERLVRHIGITGHWSAAALMYAIQRDRRRILDTLLVAVNPADPAYLSHQTNTIPTAVAAGMGVIAMKVFADASYYGEPPTFMRTPQTVYQQVGHAPIESTELIRYALSAEGVCLCLTGIGHIDPDPARCQIAVNVSAAQTDPMAPSERGALETRMRSDNLQGINAYFERTSTGLGPARNVGAEFDPTGFSPVTPNVRPAVRISWNAAYAGRSPVARYEVLRNGLTVGTVLHRPQASGRMFVFNDDLGAGTTSPPSRVEKHAVPSAAVTMDPDLTGTGRTIPRWARHHSNANASASAIRGLRYIVRAIDADGRRSDADPVSVLMPAAATPFAAWEAEQHIDDVSSFDSPDPQGMSAGAGRSSGRARFDNGDEATFKIAFTIKLKDGSGTHEVFCRYEFADGSSFLMTGVGTTIQDGDGALFSGNGIIILGTGRFERLRGVLEYYGRRIGPPKPGSATTLTYRLL